MKNNRKITIQIQSVLYNTEITCIHKTLGSIKNALNVAKRNGVDIETTFIYGDSSKKRILSASKLAAIRKTINNSFYFKYVYFNSNLGTAKGHNVLSKGCNSEYIMIMNPDVIVSPMYFVDILSPFSNNEVGMVEARQTPIEHPKKYDLVTKETEWATTACCVIKYSLFKELNGFDDKTFFMYCDDLDFSWRLRSLGYKIIYQSLSPVFHAKRLSATANWQPTSAEIYYSAEADLLLSYKWNNNLRVERLLNIYSNGNKECKKAAAEFNRRKNEGLLPKQIIANNVSRFVGDHFTEHRFEM